MLEELLARFEHFEVVGGLAWTNNNRLLGLNHLPLSMIPKATVTTDTC